MLYLSGVAAIFVGLSFSVIPSLLARYNHNKKPVSYTGTIPGIRKLYNFGIITFPALLIIFTFHLALLLNLYPFSPGILILTAGNLTCIGMGVVPMDKAFKIHDTLAKSSFVLITSGTFLLSLEMFSINTNLAFLGMLASVCGGLGMWYFMAIKNRHALAEYWGYTFLAIWVISFYFYF